MRLALATGILLTAIITPITDVYAGLLEARRLANTPFIDSTDSFSASARTGPAAATSGQNAGVTCGDPGALDPDFGVGGKLITPIGTAPQEAVANALALQTNGKILVAGTFAGTPDSQDVLLVRYNADGTFDPTFGTEGKVITDIAAVDGARAVAVQADGKIIAAGGSGPQSDQQFLLLRYNTDGTLDPSFGTGGKVLTNIQGLATSVAIQTDGKILVTGRTASTLAVVRFNTNGSLDISFGNSGIVTAGSEVITGGSLVIQTDGKIVAASDKHLVRLNADGSFDNTLGGDGIADYDYGDGWLDVQEDGRIVIVGGTQSFEVARLNSDGTRDISFGTNGLGAVFDLPIPDHRNNAAKSVVVQRDGRIVVAGYVELGDLGNSSFAVVRYNPDGSLDTSFGTGGAVTTKLGNHDDRANAVAFQDDGRMVAAGFAQNVFTEQLGLVRYLEACGPEITVAHPASTYLNDNGSLGFGTGMVGTSLPVKTFTIRNDGAAALGLGAVTVTGTNSGDFVVNTSGMASTLAPGETTSFTVTFTPGGPGARSCLLQIANTDPDENPYDLILKGRGLSGVIYTLNVASVNGRVFSNPITRIDCPGDCTESFDEGEEAVVSLTEQPEPHYRFAGWSGDASGIGSSMSVSINANKNVTANFLPITQFDVDRDTRADLAVWRPSDATWYTQTSTSFSFRNFGQPGDMLVPADYDNDNKMDIAVFRPSNGNWYYLRSNIPAFVTVALGQPGDIPIPMDRGGLGEVRPGVFRPSNGTFSVPGFVDQAPFGVGDYVPVRGDFDGDGKDDLAVYGRSDHIWRIARSSGGTVITTWGADGDKVVPADYDGDGVTDIAVWRPSNGTWYILGSSAGWIFNTWGVAGDIPVPADYDGDGRTDLAIFRPSNGTWYIINSTEGYYIRAFGQNGDVPIPSAYIY